MESFIVLQSSIWLTEKEIVKIIMCNHLPQLVSNCFLYRAAKLTVPRNLEKATTTVYSILQNVFV